MMANNRRIFLKQATMLAGAFSANSIFNQVHAANFKQASQKIKHLTPQQVASDEDYWSIIQQSFSVSPNIINLNNGGVSPTPIVAQKALDRYNQLANEGPSYFMWRIIDQGREPLREKLAGLAGTTPEEIAINRNATESLNTIIYGLNLKSGDEVIGCRQDYPHMMQAYKQRAAREGIVYKQLDFVFPIEDDEEIVKAYESACTPKTKIIHVTHVVNWTGQIMPVRKICDMAHSKGIEVVVDGFAYGLLNRKTAGTNVFELANIGAIGVIIAQQWPYIFNFFPFNPNHTAAYRCR